ncbi:MAG TPA: DNA-deoxyinosine glycosylase [Spongiibacteraceae bacterium]|nr:DNA-deoxyinosine glycosylase [Spongiibacteraceae bacterium]
MMAAVESFSYIANPNCHTLILGTMPGTASLARQQYYAHTRNAFWRIIGDLFAIDPRADYADRILQLAEKNIAVWDVLQTCVRKGSLDAAIETESIVPNDIAGFLTKHQSIQRICFNGGTAAKLFRRHIQSTLTAHSHIDYLPLPSTSPAHAGMSYADKLQAWRLITTPLFYPGDQN